MAVFNIASKPYSCPSLTITTQTIDSCNVYIYINKEDGLSNYKIYIDNSLVTFESSDILETPTQIRYTLHNTSNTNYIFRAEATCDLLNNTISSDNLTYQPNKIPNTTDVYAIFDTTSMRLQDGIDASNALQNWHNEYKINNPDYEGNLYILPYSIERYVDYLNIIYEGTRTTTSGSWDSIAIKPPGYNTGSWVPPTEILLLGFVDESHSEYHAISVASGFNTQPTSIYVNDLNNFQNVVTNFNYFKAVIYPIVQNLNGTGGALVLQLLAAMKGKLLTQQEIDDTNTLVDVSLLKTQNPYIGLTPLEDLNFIGVYNKISPASSVFNSTTFNNELNDLIEENNNTCN